MKTEEYKFQGNPIFQNVPLVGNLVYDERGKEVLAVHNEKFKGIKHVEDKESYKKNQPISYSNVPRILSYEQILRERFPDMHILSPEEVVLHWDVIPERNETYADTNSIVVYPNQGSNENLRQLVLKILNKGKTEIPLVVSGLGVERADNNYGFTLTETPYLLVREAPFLKEDGRLSYDGTSLIQSKEGIPVYVPDDQNDFRRFCRVWSDGLYARNDDLHNSDGDGRVQILYGPQGRAENLEEKLKQLQEDRDQQIAEIDSRYEKASEYLRTGNFQ